MKLGNLETREKIKCPKCGGDKFTDFEIPKVLTSTLQIFCKKEGCGTDLLISSKDVLKTKVIVKRK